MKNTRIGRLLEQLQQAAIEQQLSKLEICRRAGLHANTLRNFKGYMSEEIPDRPPWLPTPSVIAALEAVLLPPFAAAAPKKRKAARKR